MGKRIWLALAVAILFAASGVAGLAGASPRHAPDARPKTVTRGLDYLHSQQQPSGDFGTSENTIWGILGAVASGERVASKFWTIGGNTPFTALQTSDLKKEATAVGVNAPAYYSLAIMAYVASGQKDSVATAGSPAVDLLAKLYQYQDMTDGSPYKGRFSPSSRNPTDEAVDTTAWAILALEAGGGSQARLAAAVDWLAGQQNGDGGFPAHQYSASSNVEDTALAIQAFVAAGKPASDPLIQGSASNPGARKFILGNQRPDGGFPYVAGGSTTDGTSTAATVQAIVAMGENPSAWKYGTSANSPAGALADLQLKSGAYQDATGDSGARVSLTSWTLAALMDKPFSTYPKELGTKSPGFVYKPQITSARPADHAKFTGTHTVLIQARYTDGTKLGQVGTGVNAKACRVYVDDVNRTSHAKIGSTGLRLQLKNVPDGAHTYKLSIVDNAGNVRELTRAFTVAAPSPTPTTAPTYTPPYVPTTPTPTPSTTLYPTPTDSGSPYPDSSSSPAPETVSGAAIPSPSPSSGVGVTVGSASAGGFVGAMLLAMLPIGAAMSFLIMSRREHALDDAGEGKVLGGGGSPWDRLKHRVKSLKDLAKPAGR
ncbi:MAG: hypothetical protein WCN81_01520 [Actinomycetes bacterium]